MLLSIIIPAYNEEKRILQMLERYWAFYQGKSVEFIIVLNGCRDNTRGVVESFASRVGAKIHIIDIPEAIGKGGAVRQGFALAQGDYLGFVDADGATGPEEFDKLVRQINGHDGAIASRWKRGSVVVGRNFFRKIVSLGFIIFVKMIFWMPFFDTQCGAKVFKHQAIKQILPKLQVSNMAFDVELLFLMRRAGYRIIEMPTVWLDKSSSAILGSPLGIIKNSFKMLFTLFSIRTRK
jgi:glycosyltransferase involved in cell wall biosynthesis